MGCDWHEQKPKKRVRKPVDRYIREDVVAGVSGKHCYLDFRGGALSFNLQQMIHLHTFLGRAINYLVQKN